VCCSEEYVGLLELLNRMFSDVADVSDLERRRLAEVIWLMRI
jgi:hypothetical protein